MASAVYARQLAAEDSERHWEGIQGAGRPYDAIMDRDSSYVASSSKAPLPVSLLIRPGMGRQLSSVSNLIDAYRNSPTAHNSASSSTNDGNTHSRRSSMNITSISAPNSPSTPALSSSNYDRSHSPSHPPRSLYYSQIITRRSSMQVSGSPRAPTSGSSDLSPLVRERRPSAPEIHSPPTPLMSGSAGAHGWNATLAPSGSSSNNNNMASLIDIKRLRSKPAPPHSHASATAGQNWMPPSSTSRDQDCMPTEEGQSLSSITALPTAAMPKRDLDTAIEPLTTMLHNTQISSSSLASTSSASSVMRMNTSSDPRAGPAYSTSASSAESRGAEQRQGQYHNQHPPQQASSSHSLHTLYDSPSSTLGNHRHTPQSREDISNTSNTHVDDSLYHHYPASSGRSRFDSSTSNTDTTSSHYTTTGPLPRPPSPQTPRKIRNSSLPMGTSPSLSSSPNPGTGKQSPSSSASQRRPLKPIVPTSHTVLLPGQPALPPASPRFRSKSANNDYNVGEMYESILPTSSSLRPNRQPSSDNMFITSPPSTSAAMITSPEDELPVDVASPSRVRKERGILSPGSPTPHKKLVPKSSRGHLRRDSGTSGHGQTSTTTSIAAHSRSLSLPRTSSRGSTPTAGTGSGSGSEQDDTTTILSSSNSHSHFFTQRPAWLDQDPAASNSIPPLPNASNLTSRIKSPPQHPLLSQSNNRSMTSLHQQYNVDGAGLDSSFFGPSSLPTTSTLAAQHAHREEPQAAPPKRKASFYRRKRSQTASGSENVDSNGFPIPSPMSEIVKSMPLHGRMSHDVLQPPPALPPKRNASASSGGGGGFLSSITRKLSHPNIKDPSPTFAPVNVDPSTDYFAGACPPPPEKSHTHPIPQQHHHSSPKLGSSFSSRSWLHPFGGDHSKHHNDSKALPQLPQAGSNGPMAFSSGKGIYGDPFSASSTMSLPGFLHRSPRKDSLSSDKSEQSSGHRRKDARSRTISQDGDSSDGHSSEVGYTSLRSYDLAPPVPEVPFGMRNTAGSPPAASTLPKASKKSHGLLRSPSLGQRGKKAAPDLDLSPTTPRAAVFNSNDNGINDEALPSPTRAGMLVISKANESLNSARRKGLGDSMRASSESSRNDGRSDVQHDQAPSKLGSFAAMDKIAAIENDMKEAKFMALWDRSERAEKGVIKLSLASSAAREAGIA